MGLEQSASCPRPTLTERPTVSYLANRPLLSLRFNNHENGAATAIHQQESRLSGLAHQVVEVAFVVDRLLVDRLDHVALLQAGLCRRAAFVNARNHDTLGRRRQLKLLSDIRSQVLYLHTLQRAAGVLALGGWIRIIVNRSTIGGPAA